MPKRAQRPELSKEVSDAVNDILFGVSVDNHTEWLQREYIRMMRREAKMKAEMNVLESKLSKKVDESNGDNGSPDQNRPAEQHSTTEQNIA